MSRRGRADFLRAGTALGLLVIATAQASAGGFGIREQSAYGQGTSFAGVAAGGALSSMFWNPATLTQVPGIQSETAVSGLLPYARHTPGSGSALAGAPFNSAARQIRQSGASVPASYLSYQYSPNLWFGLSINAPFGLSLNFPDRWAGRDLAPVPPTCIVQCDAEHRLPYQRLAQRRRRRADPICEPNPHPRARSTFRACELTSKAMAGVTASPRAPLSRLHRRLRSASAGAHSSIRNSTQR